MERPDLLTLPTEEPEAPIPAPGEDVESEHTESAEGTEDYAALRRELEVLKEQLQLREREEAHLRETFGEFRSLFPGVRSEGIPDSVWQEVDRGIPLCAAFALHEKRMEAERHRADEVNRRNARLSAGRAGTDTAAEYFSPDEVRAMSPSQVREHYAKIRASMKKWNG